MAEEQLRPLHLHTVESLTNELISGRAIGIGNNNNPFFLSSKASRAILDWYRKNKNRWLSPVNEADAEAIVGLHPLC